MPKMSDDDYKILNAYMRKVLVRAGVEGDALVEATEDIMHPLTALVDTGEDSQEFIPYMRMKLGQWVGPNAGRL